MARSATEVCVAVSGSRRAIDRRLVAVAAAAKRVATFHEPECEHHGQISLGIGDRFEAYSELDLTSQRLLEPTIELQKIAVS